MTITNTEGLSELPDDLARYIRRATEMSEDGVYAWWSRLAALLTELQSRRAANSAGGVEVLVETNERDPNDGDFLAFPAVEAEPVAAWRHKCAGSGFHDHDGCSCSDAELRARYTHLSSSVSAEVTVTDEMVERAKAELFKRGIVDVFSVRSALESALNGGR